MIKALKASCQDYDLYVLNIESKGIKLDFDLSELNKPVKQDEKISVKFTGDLSSADSKVIEIAVTYAVKGTVTPLGQRVLYFTVSDYEASSDNSPGMTQLENGFSIFTSLLSGFIARILSLFKPVFQLLKSI